jgi:hypothetical protein
MSAFRNDAQADLDAQFSRNVAAQNDLMAAKVAHDQADRVAELERRQAAITAQYESALQAARKEALTNLETAKRAFQEENEKELTTFKHNLKIETERRKDNATKAVER